MRKWIVISVLSLSVIFCNLGAPNPALPPTLDVNPASTLMAAASATAEMQITPDTPQPTTGTITGRLSYPSETLPPMRVTAFDIVNETFSYIDTQPGQTNYSFELPVGTYHIVAYSIASGAFPGGFPSGYTKAVTCGLAVECADHDLISVVVEGGVTLSGIDPTDSYAPTGTFPPMPGTTGAAGTGIITGRLSYPSEVLPPMRVTAFDIINGKFSYIDTQPGQANYSFELPVGTYHIVAYAIDKSTISGGYTEAVICGLTVECADHSLIEVIVTAGVTTPDIDPGDFYAPEGSFPPMPEN